MNHKRRPHVPWPQIKADYLRGMSANQCAEKYDVSFFTISSRSKRERWGAERKPGWERPVNPQVGADIDSGLVDKAMQSVEINLAKAGDANLSDIERRRSSLIAKTSASTLKDLMIAREKQARISRDASAGAAEDDTLTVIGIRITDQAIAALAQFEELRDRAAADHRREPCAPERYTIANIRAPLERVTRSTRRDRTRLAQGISRERTGVKRIIPGCVP